MACRRERGGARPRTISELALPFSVSCTVAAKQFVDPFVCWGCPTPQEPCRREWIAGAHSDVGGGYQHRELAEIPLRWMAQEAVSAGLQLKLELLTKEADLKPLAAQYESRQGWSLKDRATPTIREMEGDAPEVTFYERLYVSRDGKRKILKPINESTHESVLTRFKQQVVILNSDDDTKGSRQRYNPRNLAAAIAQSQQNLVRKV
jgi:Uncharacterized alpha/beta hydrolase domain (DUF2235)